MANKALSIITNFGCHFQCPECIVRNNHIDVPKTTLAGLDGLIQAYIKNDCSYITISGGGDPLYQYENHVDWYRKLFKETNNISLEIHTSYLTDQSTFPFYDCYRVVYHAHTLNDLKHISRTGCEKVRVVYVVTPDFTVKDLMDIAYCVLCDKDIDELSFRQYVDSNYNAVPHLDKYLKLGHRKLWYYIEQGDYNLYYAENEVYTSYQDFQNISSNNKI